MTRWDELCFLSTLSSQLPAAVSVRRYKWGRSGSQGSKDAFWILPVTELARWGCASRYLLHAPCPTLIKILFLIVEPAGDSYFDGKM
jgi:hypothetical protein